MSDAEFLNQFEATSLPYPLWTHRAHVKVAYLYLRQLPFDEAMVKIRSNIKAYNAAKGTPETLTSGYNETTTRGFLHLVAAVMRAYSKVLPVTTADEFCDAHPQLMTSKALRLFYSPERRMTPEAKEKFVEPDLAPLPKIISS
jgi:hypothetical protein